MARRCWPVSVRASSPSAAEAAERFLQLTETYTPEPARHAEYTRQYELYRQVYPAVAPISHQL